MADKHTTNDCPSCEPMEYQGSDVLKGHNPRLANRHRGAKVFAWFCGACAWLGVVLLVILIWNIGVDGLGWIWERTLNDPRLLAERAAADPEFAAQLNEIKRNAWLSDEELLAEAEEETRKEIAEAEEDGEAHDPYEVILAFNFQREQEKRMGKLHTIWLKDREELKALGIAPTVGERLNLAWQITRGILGDFASRFPTKSGILSALIGSMYLLIFTALFSIPIGVAAALYLEEYTSKSRLNRFIEVNIANLAGVPSIVYGILGLVVFVRTLALGRSIIAGAATMSLLILPVIIIAAREAIKAVPRAIREGAFALGATRWQVTSQHVLPVALPGILTGVILAMSRAIGETAPMIMIGALAFVAFVPQGPMDDFTVLPIQIFNWAARPQEEFHALAAAGIILLLALLLLMNSVAIVIRHRAQRNLKW